MLFFRDRTKIAHVVAAVVLATTGMPAITHAEDFLSTNFLAKNPLTNLFGGFGSSTSFFSFLSGGQTVTGEASSTNFAVAAGFLYFDTFMPESRHWRWYDDYANETPTSPMGAEDTAPSNVNNGDTAKLRITVNETADIGQAGTKFALQYARSSDFTVGLGTVSDQGSCNGSSQWCYADGGGADNGLITTPLISDAVSCSGGVGDGCGTHNESGTVGSTFTHKKSTMVEYEFTITESGGVPNTVYFFRLFDRSNNTAVPLATSMSYPSLATGGTSLDVEISGLASSTAVSGVTTDIDTTPTAIGFGTLPPGTPVTGAQRFTVTTNAISGYRIFAFERQALLSDTGSSIVPTTGTNASPAGWTPGCATLASCYGYHTDAAVLSGGSTRFAPDDTYAKFETTPREVAYSAGPAASSTTNFVYRLAATGLQDAGSYSSNVVYIVVPTF